MALEPQQLSLQNIAFQEWGDSQSNEQIVLIHGWGMNSAVWTDIAQYLAQVHPNKSIIAVDLPGYGYSAKLDAGHNSHERVNSHAQASSHELAKSLEPLLFNKQSTIIAWSMGGLVALELLMNRSLDISKLILVSSSPCFVQSSDWSYAVEAKVFTDFKQSLSKDHQASLKRFLAIQAMGSRTAREDIKTLQKHLLSRGEPTPEALDAGLTILLSEDKRQQLRAISDIPISLICGKCDTLVAYKGQKQLARQANISLFSIPHAGHAPFISHPQKFKQILKNII